MILNGISRIKKINLFCALNFSLFISIGLSYLFDQNKDYQFQAPFIVKVIPDLIYILILFSFTDIKNIYKALIKNVVIICQLITTLIVLTHLVSKLDIFEWMHFYFRNYIFYSLSIFLLPSLISSNKVFLYMCKLFEKYLFALSVASLLLYILGITYEGRLISFFKDPLRCAYIYTSFNVIFLLPHLLFESRDRKMVLINFLLSSLCILLAASFGAIIVLITSILFLFLGHIYYFGKKFEFGFLSTIAFLFLMACYLSGFLNILEIRFINMIYHPLFQHLLDQHATSTSISSRLDQYLSVYNVIQNQSVAELLFGNFSAEHVITSDSNYLQIFFNFGFIGLVVFLVMNFFILKTCLNLLTNHKKFFNSKSDLTFSYCLGFGVFFLVMIIFGFNFVSITTQFPFSYIYFLFIGGVFAIYNLQNKKAS